MVALGPSVTDQQAIFGAALEKPLDSPKLLGERSPVSRTRGLSPDPQTSGRLMELLWKTW